MSYPFPWGPPPDNYIPGLGRSAEGFSGKIEDAVIEIEDPHFGNPNMSAAQIKKEEEADKKADEFYKTIEENLKKRKKKKNEDEEENQTVFQKTKDSFADLTDGLKSITEEQWANLPEIGATTAHRPVWDYKTYSSDRALLGDYSNSLLYREANETDDIMALSKANHALLNVQLSKFLPDSNSIDVSGYQAEFEAQTSAVLTKYQNNLDHAERIYHSLTKANPTYDMPWIIRARIQEKLGKLDNARKIIERGLTFCNNSESLVLEAARLSSHSDAISLIESFLKVNLQKSEKLWLALIGYQNNESSKKNVIEEALHVIPQSEAIWRAASVFEDENHSEIIKRGLEFIPQSKSLWIEGILGSRTIEEASDFFQKALEKFPEDPDILLSWAKTQEKFSPSTCKESNLNLCYRAFESESKNRQAKTSQEMTSKQINDLENNPSNPMLDLKENKQKSDEEEKDEDTNSLFKEIDLTVHDEILLDKTEPDKNWFEEAEKAEISGFPITAESIIKVLPFSKDFANHAEITNNCNLPVVTNSLLLRSALEDHQWKAYFNFKAKMGSLEEAITEFTSEFPQNEEIPLAASYVLQTMKNPLQKKASLSVLFDAAERMPTSSLIAEKILNLLIENDQIEDAYEFGLKSIGNIRNETLFFKVAQIADVLADRDNQHENIINLLQNGVNVFPKEKYLWLMLINHSQDPLNVIKKAIEILPNAAELHLELIKYAKNIGMKIPVIRALFETARRDCQNDPLIWLTSAQFENDPRILEQALNYVDNPGLIWARQVELAPPENRFSMANEIYNCNGKYKEVRLEQAISEWKHDAIDRARKIFIEICERYPEWGDGWLWRIKFEKYHGSSKNLSSIFEELNSIELTDGFVWKRSMMEKRFFGLNKIELIEALNSEIIDPITVDTSSIFLDYLLI